MFRYYLLLHTVSISTFGKFHINPQLDVFCVFFTRNWNWISFYKGIEADMHAGLQWIVEDCTAFDSDMWLKVRFTVCFSNLIMLTLPCVQLLFIIRKILEMLKHHHTIMINSLVGFCLAFPPLSEWLQWCFRKVVSELELVIAFWWMIMNLVFL